MVKPRPSRPRGNRKRDQRAPKEGQGLPEKPNTILVADDEHLVAHGLAVNLRELGFEVLGPASDGDKAIDLCREHHPDMAMLDIRMPGTSGLAAAETIFQKFSIPVMIFSAFSDTEYANTASRVGVFGYLLKPVTQDQMRVSIGVAWARFVEFVGRSDEAEVLQKRLDDRRVIEQGKWVLVKSSGMDEPEAMRMLQQHARNNRLRLVDVARTVIEKGSLPEASD